MSCEMCACAYVTRAAGTRRGVRDVHDVACGSCSARRAQYETCAVRGVCEARAEQGVCVHVRRVQCEARLMCVLRGKAEKSDIWSAYAPRPRESHRRGIEEGYDLENRRKKEKRVRSRSGAD